MKKERNWVDYANLASSVAQNFQLRHANETLEGLERVATERANREERQRDQERHLDRLREHISQIAEEVVSLQEHLRENPCAALALGLQIKGLLEKHSVTTASFKAWEDKDRLRDAQKRLESVCEQSMALLTDPQREDAVRCATYLAECDALDQLIGVQRRKEVFDLGRLQFEKQLATKQGELATLKSRQTGLASWMIACFTVGGLGLVFCCYCVAQLALNDFTLGQGVGIAVPGFVVALVFFGSGAIISFPLFTPAWTRQRELARKTKALEIDIAKLKAELDRYDQNSPIISQQSLELELGLPDFHRFAEQIEIERGELSQLRATQQRWDELIAMFGADRSAEQYEVMKREREAFIQTIFGGSKTPPEQRLN
jgi:hypothetical protein